MHLQREDTAAQRFELSDASNAIGATMRGSDLSAGWADVVLRPATETADDQNFLLALFATTREEELGLLNLPETQKHIFLQMQFTAQDRYYRQRYPTAHFWIVLHGGRPVGRLYLDEGDTAFHLIDISLLPHLRGAGLGTALLRTVIAKADAVGLPVWLHVARSNRAQHLYGRLGFEIVASTSMYLEMARFTQSTNAHVT